MFGEAIAHGTPFRRAVQEGLLDCDRVAQIGLRGTGYSAEDFDWGREQGFRVVQAEECWHKSLVPLMKEICDKVGKDGKPVYISFDIDALDPAFAPGFIFPLVTTSFPQSSSAKVPFKKCVVMNIMFFRNWDTGSGGIDQYAGGFRFF